MTRGFLRWTLLGLIAAVALASLWPSIRDAIGVKITWQSEPTDTQNYTEGFCVGKGVALVVDYGVESNREISVRCATDFSGSGWDLFATTGHPVTGTANYPTGFVCKIDSWPNQGQDCADTPTNAEGSWAYFYATAETDEYWQFSGEGSAVRKPRCGEVEGWRFVSANEKTTDQAPRVNPELGNCK